MGTFVDSSLQKGEKVLKRAWITWITQIHWFFLAFCFFGMGLGAPIFLFFSLLCVGAAWLNVTTTELAVTNKRIIGKFGWIARQTLDLPLRKVETVKVSEGILGRFLGYGAVSVVGTGGNGVGFKFIAGPMQFRQAAMQIVEDAYEASMQKGGPPAAKEE